MGGNVLVPIAGVPLGFGELSWWAYSFPLATIAIATLVMYEQTGLTVFAGLAWLLLTLVTLVVVYLLARTARAVAGHRICVPAP